MAEYQVITGQIKIPTIELSKIRTSARQEKGIQIYTRKDIPKGHTIIPRCQELNNISVDVRRHLLNLDSAGKRIEEAGGRMTLLAMKSPTSYMIVTNQSSLTVIEDCRLIYSKKLSDGGLFDTISSLEDLIYIPHQDFYLIIYNEKIYRKDINEKPHYIYISLQKSHLPGQTLRYSDIQKRLLIAKDDLSISAINLKTKKIEFEVAKNLGNGIEDFKVLGKMDDRVVALTGDGYLLLYKLIYAEKTGLIDHYYRIRLIKERDEQGVSLAISNDNQYVCVELGQDDSPWVCSRMMIFKLDGNTLVLNAALDQYR